MRSPVSKIDIINNIFEEILLRPASTDEIELYSQYIPYKENHIRKELIRSKEHILLRNDGKTINTSIPNPQISNKTKLIFIKGQDVPTKIIDTNNKNVLVLSLTKDCTIHKTLDSIKGFIKELKLHFKTVKLGAFTNNNFDDTIDLLLEWQKKDQDIFIVKYRNELITMTDDINGLCGNRMYKLAQYREHLLRHSLDFFDMFFDYIIVFDSDVILEPQSVVKSIIDSISIDKPWSAISANNCFQKSNIHYDILALRLFGQPIDITQIYPEFREHYGHNHKWNSTSYIFKDFVQVHSAFGGLTIYDGPELIKACKMNNKLYDMTNMPKCTCEHISLADKLQKPHYINSNMKLSSPGKIEGIMYNQPVLFLPRDAGFFSVFNFLLGTISTGTRAYPFFNKQLFLKYRNTNQHFCYWTDSENCWFDFFEPIRYYDKDNEHQDKSYLKYPISGGEESPQEFRTPRLFKSLLQDSSGNFQEWRDCTHNIYNQYIKFKPDIIDHCDIVFKNMFKKQDYVIGLHYRHPSHSVESGPLFLQQYYDQIDKIIDKHSRAKIFLATDTEFGLMAFKYRYGNKVHCLDNIERLPVDNILEWAYALNTIGPSDNIGIIKNRGYQLHHSNIFNNQNYNYYNFTRNLLTEVLCLSKCNILINGTSNISLALSYINPKVPMITI